MYRILLSLFFLSSIASFGQGFFSCTAGANPPLVRVEGIAERMGDITLNCTGGQPNAVITGNLVFFLSVNVTNHILPDGTADTLLTVNGAPANVAGRVTSNAAVTFNGLSFTLTPQGTADIRLQNLRGNASQLIAQTTMAIIASATFNAGSLATFTTNQFTVAVPQRSLFATAAGRLICSQNGSPLPSTITFANLVAAGTTYSSTRVTEGFASAFAPKSDISNQNADSGVRIISTYSGFPAGARLFVPDLVAGFNADQPTSTGDFGQTISAGAYTPGKGQLLLARVNGADAAGAGGTPVTSSLGAVSELQLNNGTAYAVYEVVDASMTARESAALPVFLGLPANGPSAVTDSTVNLAPVSTVVTAGSAPIPRFISIAPDSDCKNLGDCSASYFPRLAIGVTSLRLVTNTAATAYIPIRNGGSGLLQWTASTTASYLTLAPSQGVNNGTVRVDLKAASGLTPGVYNTTIVIDGGPAAGSQIIPVTVVIDPPGGGGGAITPTLGSVTSAANSGITAVVPGSLATIYGSSFTGKIIAATFDGVPGTILYSSDTQVNVAIPAALAGKSTAKLVLTVDGNQSAPMTVNIASSAPAIFSGAVLNQDWSANSSTAVATTGSVLQIFATGLPASGITAKVHDRVIVVPAFAGPAPGLPGVQQVNVAIPTDLPAMQTYVYVCGGDVCSPAEKIWIR